MHNDMYKRTDNNFHSRPVTLTATDGRFADRFREMMQIVDFGNEASFRTNKR